MLVDPPAPGAHRRPARAREPQRPSAFGAQRAGAAALARHRRDVPPPRHLQQDRQVRVQRVPGGFPSDRWQSRGGARRVRREVGVVADRHDPGRGRWIILAPERVFNPDDTAVEVLKLLDGQRSVNSIAEALSQEYQAPLDVVTTDIVAMLQDLTDKGVLVKA